MRKRREMNVLNTHIIQMKYGSSVNREMTENRTNVAMVK
jgi:hypothetical protein